jgi:GNAT superfamily N-acetyltransferase
MIQCELTLKICNSKIIPVGVGGSIGAILGANNYMGKSVYVPNAAECENRIIVDYAEGLKRKQDVGFIAIAPQTTRFEPCGGVMACVDGQLRNSPQSHMGVQTIDGFPSHLHIKNMLVHDSMRRQGVAMEMMDAFEAYGRDETDAEMLTLEVDELNTGAVNLYKKAGFEFVKNPTSFTKRKFMTKKL